MVEVVTLQVFYVQHKMLVPLVVKATDLFCIYTEVSIFSDVKGAGSTHHLTLNVDILISS